MSSMSKKQRELRAMWLPKYPVLARSCASCPFAKGNDTEFGEIVRKLHIKEYGKPPDPKEFPKMIRKARINIKMESAMLGDFICHQTAYNEDMSMRKWEEYRQCPGAAKIYKGE